MVWSNSSIFSDNTKSGSEKFNVMKKASACNFQALYRLVKTSEHNGQFSVLNKTQLAPRRQTTQIKNIMALSSWKKDSLVKNCKYELTREMSKAKN